MLVRIIAVFSILLLVSPAFADKKNLDEEAVWALEEAYWVFVQNDDIERYKALWDERFVGWPGRDLKPAYKKNIADWIPPLHANPKRRPQFELTQVAVRSFGDVVVTHYIAKCIYIEVETGASSEGWANKVTHTWQRYGDTWKIITGMAGEYSPRE